MFISEPKRPNAKPGVQGKAIFPENKSSLQRVVTLTVPSQIQPLMDPPRSFPDVASWTSLYHVLSHKSSGEQGHD